MLFYNVSVQGGSPYGIKMIDNPTKTMQGIFFTRDKLSEFMKLQEAEYPGVYVLYNSLDDKNVYIGQSSSSVASRLTQHNAKKDFWNTAIVFVEKGDFRTFNGIHAKIIESNLLQRAKDCNMSVVDNKANSVAPRVSDADKYAAMQWTEEVINIIGLLGLPFFKNDVVKVVSAPVKNEGVASDNEVKEDEEVKSKIESVDITYNGQTKNVSF